MQLALCPKWGQTPALALTKHFENSESMLKSRISHEAKSPYESINVVDNNWHICKATWNFSCTLVTRSSCPENSTTKMHLKKANIPLKLSLENHSFSFHSPSLHTQHKYECKHTYTQRDKCLLKFIIIYFIYTCKINIHMLVDTKINIQIYMSEYA